MISFVIPAYDEEPWIGATVDALHRAGREVGDYEIIVVDDASQDRTAAVASAHGARVVSVEHRQIAATRNAGARAASGSLLIFVDADTIVPVETVSAAVQAVADGVVAGGCICAFDEPVPRWVRVIERPLMRLVARARITPGAFLFCTREAFDAVGGFDESRYGGEEVLIARTLDKYSKTRKQRFTIVPHTITTSARKLRAYSPFELLRALLVVGMRGARSRRGMDIWYGKRRRDPATPPTDAAD